ncbi:MAG: hydrogenase formation protein HypD, partial [Campylobacteraceae bacterium]|nr:hydrogenase formation protein HypD [Campylobacteraceae bacterium]
FVGPSHVSVITGSKIYEPIVEKFNMPIVVAGFEPVDVMEYILRIVRQVKRGEAKVENQYTRAVTREGNIHAQALVDKYFIRRPIFRWRGIGDIPNSALMIKPEFSHLDAEVVFEKYLPKESIDDHKLCICGQILKGLAKPYECKVFGKACIPSSPMGSCMVSSEGACAAYFKYGALLAKGK